MHSSMEGNGGRSPVQSSASDPAPAPSAALAPGWTGPPGTVPVVTVVSRTAWPSCTRVALTVDAVLPCLSQLTCTSAAASCGTRRKLALVATGCGCGEQSSTARSTVASSAPPLTAGGVAPPGATSANRGSAAASYNHVPVDAVRSPAAASISLRRLTAVASSNAVIRPGSPSTLGFVTHSYAASTAAVARLALRSRPELALQLRLGFLERSAVGAGRQVL